MPAIPPESQPLEVTCLTAMTPAVTTPAIVEISTITGMVESYTDVKVIMSAATANSSSVVTYPPRAARIVSVKLRLPAVSVLYIKQPSQN